MALIQLIEVLDLSYFKSLFTLTVKYLNIALQYNTKSRSQQFLAIL